MDVRFYATTSAKLPTLPIVNGQLIYLEDNEASYYDMGNTRRPLAGVRLVPSLPSTGQKDMLYVVIDNSGNAIASIWDPTTTSYKSISGQIATTAAIGLVKPDGSTIQIDANGTISSHAEVTSLPASSITYVNTTSGLTADDAQEAIDELEVIASGASTAAAAAQSDVDGAIRSIGTINETIAGLITRLEAVEAVAARALITEDPAPASTAVSE